MVKLRNSDALKAFVGKGEGRIMTSAELAKRLGKSRHTIDHLLSGRRNTCPPEFAAQVEEILQVPSGIIFIPVAGDPMLASA